MIVDARPVSCPMCRRALPIAGGLFTMPAAHVDEMCRPCLGVLGTESFPAIQAANMEEITSWQLS